MSRLGARTNPRIRLLTADELRIKQIQLEHGEFLPWFLQEATTLPVTAGMSIVPLPVGFLREVDEVKWLIVDAEGGERELVKRRVEWIDSTYGPEDEGTPKYYGLLQNSIRLGPKADQEYSIRLEFMKAQPLFEDGTTPPNLWLRYAFNWFAGETMAEVAATHLQNGRKAAELRSAAAMAKIALIAATEARKHTNMDYSDQGL
jgi:hypothetical protein